MRCASCDHWHEGASPLATASPDRNPLGKPGVGTCQLDPPTLAETQWFPVSMFPETHADRSCSDWSPRFDPEPGAREDIPEENAPRLRAVA